MLKVNSEIGNLKKVLLHRPGKELENLTPDLLEVLLFDDIPYLKIAQEEHDAFSKVLRENGVEVVYIEKLAAETLQDLKLREKFVAQFIKEARVSSKTVSEALLKYLLALDVQEMVDKMIAGIRIEELSLGEAVHLTDMVTKDYPFVTDPLPNLLFQRDPFASIGKGVTINKMHTFTRRRETIFADYIFKYHPDYKEDLEVYYDREEEFNIEGGDELVLSEKVLAIGISERTSAAAIEKLAESLFYKFETSFETILAFELPKKRAFMHLDTVFTQIDYDKFTIHPGIMGTLVVYELKKQAKEVKVTKIEDKLEVILSKYLNRDVKVIKCGGDDIIASEREQWNDGANTLCISPGVVIVYSRNWVTNELLRKEGIQVIEIPSSELSRGRGGPRCMSMPLYREDI